MGFGFVNFESNTSAMAALSQLNGVKLREDKTMKVSIARPAWKANIHSNLYIAGFPVTFNESNVMDFLGAHATNAENVRLLRDSNRNPRGAAVVRMSCEEAASGVISSLNGVPFKGTGDGSIIQVRPWRPEFRADRISDDKIATAFVWTNRAKPARINIPVQTPQVVGPPPPPMVYPDAQQLLHQISVQHQTKGVTSLPPSTSTPETYNTDSEDDDLLATLFVFHLPSTMTETNLGDMFSQFGGQLESVQVMPHKGYGFVSFYKTADAVLAMERLNGSSIVGSSKRIRIELKY